MFYSLWWQLSLSSLSLSQGALRGVLRGRLGRGRKWTATARGGSGLLRLQKINSYQLGNVMLRAL